VGIVKRFSKNLIEVKYPTKPEHWNVAGILKNKSNQHLKFDVRDMFKLPDGLIGKHGYTNTKADKMVFESEKEWIMLDIKEIHEYLRKHKKRILYLEDLIAELEWSMRIPK
tara:strand:- start:42 stop:374 length:333 start_codon:yes stop_codon:yes gene_type:complete